MTLTTEPSSLPVSDVVDLVVSVEVHCGSFVVGGGSSVALCVEVGCGSLVVGVEVHQSFSYLGVSQNSVHQK